MEDKKKGLARQAQRYLNYKVPPNQPEPKLSDYAKKRVQYARDILEYANQSMKIYDYQKGTRDVIAFGNRCSELYGEYFLAKKAAEPKDSSGKDREWDDYRARQENFEKVEQKIIDQGEFLKKGIEDMMELCKKYPPEDKMQTICYQLLMGHLSRSEKEKTVYIKATPHNSGAQIAQSEFSSDCPKIRGNTLCISEDFWAI